MFRNFNILMTNFSCSYSDIQVQVTSNYRVDEIISKCISPDSSKTLKIQSMCRLIKTNYELVKV